MKKGALFIALTFLVNWSFALLFDVLGGRWGTPIGIAFGAAYMFVPMIVALVLQKVYREPIKEPLGISLGLNRWFLVAWLLPLVIVLATLGVSLLLPGIEYSPQMQGMLERCASRLTPEQMQQLKERTAGMSPGIVIALVLVGGLFAGITVNAVAGFGEELGWRGFLQKEWASLGFWRSSLLIGLVWGLWHAPLILQGHNYPQHPVAGVLMMTLLCVLLAPIFGYVRVKARSVIAAAIIHGTFNAVYGLAILLVRGGNDLTTGVTGLPGFLVLAAVILILWRHDPTPTRNIAFEQGT